MRELRDVIQLLRKEIRLLLFFPLLACVFVAVFLLFRQAVPQGVAQFSLVRTEANAVPEGSATYDGYYIIETHRLFGDRLGDFLLQEERLQTLADVLGDVKLVRVERNTSSDYRVFIQGKDTQSSLQYQNVLAASASQELEALSRKTGEQFSFRVAVSPMEFPSRLPPLVPLFSGAVSVGLVLGLLFIFFREYFRIS